MKILVFAPDYPAPTRRPGSPRLYNICKELAHHHTLGLCVLRPTAERREFFQSDNAEDGVFAMAVELPPVSRPPPGIRVARRIAHRLAFAPSFSRRILNPRYVRATQDALRTACHDFGADVLYADGVSCFQYAPRDRPIPLAIDMCDCFTWLVEQRAAMETSWLNRLALMLEARAIGAEERRALANADLVFTISPVDARAFQKLYARANPLVIQNGVDQDYFGYAPADTSRTLIFTGVMGYQPNADAAIYCATEIFPTLRQRYPDAQLLIVGANPSDAVLALSRFPGVTVTGAVPDVRPYMRRSAVFVCPLRIGAGVKNKLLAAMSMGLPVVTNALSLSGIAANNDEHVIVASSANEFADKIDAVFRDRTLARRLSDNGRRLVEQQYTWSSQAMLLEQALLKLVSE